MLIRCELAAYEKIHPEPDGAAAEHQHSIPKRCLHADTGRCHRGVTYDMRSRRTQELFPALKLQLTLICPLGSFGSRAFAFHFGVSHWGRTRGFRRPQMDCGSLSRRRKRVEGDNSRIVARLDLGAE